MKTIKKNVYYCDHCGKRGLSAGHISIHEDRCTANPNRVCFLCGQKLDLPKIVSELKASFSLVANDRLALDYEDEYKVVWTGTPVTLDEISNIADGCPNCILAILRQTGMNRHYFHYGFDYKKENRSYFSENKVHTDEYEY